MRLIPKDKQGKIQFCKTRLAAWVANAEQMGVPPDLIADFAGRKVAVLVAGEGHHIDSTTIKNAIALRVFQLMI
jgi:hypothetical protein